MNKKTKILLGIMMSFAFMSISNANANQTELQFGENCTERENCKALNKENGYFVKKDVIKKGEKVIVDIVIDNPASKKISSVSSWLKYNPAELKALEIKSDGSDFGLAAPDGDKINAQEGIVQIGRANIGTPIDNNQIYIASVIFEVLTDQNKKSSVEFFNYQDSELGNTGVFMISGLLTENILEKKPNNLKLTLNGANTPITKPDPVIPEGTYSHQIPTQEEKEIIENAFQDNLQRPQGFRIKSRNSKAEFVWDFDESVEGYYIYYSTQSGVYVYRRDLGRTNNATIENLQNNTKYHFAITAYNSKMEETDFSDEVFATIGQSGTESHPFLEAIYKGGVELVNPQDQKTHDVGAKHVWIFSACLAMGFVTLRKSFSLIK
jgi:hypothetical protein